MSPMFSHQQAVLSIHTNSTVLRKRPGGRNGVWNVPGPARASSDLQVFRSERPPQDTDKIRVAAGV